MKQKNMMDIYEEIGVQISDVFKLGRHCVVPGNNSRCLFSTLSLQLKRYISMKKKRNSLYSLLSIMFRLKYVFLIMLEFFDESSGACFYARQNTELGFTYFSFQFRTGKYFMKYSMRRLQESSERLASNQHLLVINDEILNETQHSDSSKCGNVA